jgi:hypothetical protein
LRKEVEKRDKTHAKVMEYNNGKTKKEKFISYFIIQLGRIRGTE